MEAVASVYIWMLNFVYTILKVNNLHFSLLILLLCASQPCEYCAQAGNCTAHVSDEQNCVFHLVVNFAMVLRNYA